MVGKGFRVWSLAFRAFASLLEKVRSSLRGGTTKQSVLLERLLRRLKKPSRNDDFLFYSFFKGSNKYSNPFALISYIVPNSWPNFPAGKPLLWYQTKYGSGSEESVHPLYLPKGIFIVTSSVNICGSIY